MIILYPSLDCRPSKPVTLEVGEIDTYDFSRVSECIYKILKILEMSNVIEYSCYDSPQEVLSAIENLLSDFNFDSDELQISEYHNIRIEFRDELLSLEVFIGV